MSISPTCPWPAGDFATPGGDRAAGEAAGSCFQRDPLKLLVPRWDVRTRVHAALLRRIDACAKRRHLAALPEGGEVLLLDYWRHERDRGDKLRGVLIAWLTRPGPTPYTHCIPSTPQPLLLEAPL